MYRVATFGLRLNSLCSQPISLCFSVSNKYFYINGLHHPLQPSFPPFYSTVTLQLKLSPTRTHCHVNRLKLPPPCYLKDTNPRGRSRIWLRGNQGIFVHLCQMCSGVMQTKWSLNWPGSRPPLRALEALGFVIAKYAFSPFWGTFLYYFWNNRILISLDKLSWKTILYTCIQKTKSWSKCTYIKKQKTCTCT